MPWSARRWRARARRPARHGSPISIACRPAASPRSSWWTCPATATRVAAMPPRATFDQLAGDYFSAGRGVTLLLVDSRHPELDADLRAWTWLVDHGVTCHVVATKVDKLTQSERRRHLAELERSVLRFGDARLGAHRRRTGSTVDTDRKAAAAAAPSGVVSRRTRHHRHHHPQGTERRRAHQARARSRHPGRHGPAQAGADLRDPPRPRGQERG